MIEFENAHLFIPSQSLDLERDLRIRRFIISTKKLARSAHFCQNLCPSSVDSPLKVIPQPV
jgi:hypothetical protein